MAIDSPTNDFGKTAKGAKAAAGFAQKGRQFIQFAKLLVKGGAGPVGWAASAAQILAPLIEKVKKGAAIVGGIIALRVLMHVMQLVGLATGLAFGAVSGLPLLLIPGAGPFLYAGWVGFWGYRGFTNPFDTIQLATHPWELITRPLSWLGQRFSNLGTYFKGGTEYVGSGVGNAASTAFYGAANLATGLASSIWGWGTSLAGNTIGWFGNIAGNALGLASTVTNSVAGIVSVAGKTTVTAVLAGSVLVASAEVVKLSTIEGDLPEENVTPGINELFTITKTVDPLSINNPTILEQKPITFTVKVTAAAKNIVPISITDQTTSSNGSIPALGNNTCQQSQLPATIIAGGQWACTLVVSANFEQSNSTITNIARFDARTEDNALTKSDSASASTKVGSPATSCPSGWPTQTGQITQGPMGNTSHGDPPVQIGTGGLEAIDIGVVHENVYSTVDGTVTATYQGGGSEDQRVDVTPVGCPDLDVVSYWHLLSASVIEGQSITAGDQVGVSGLMGTGYHTHYQFGRAFDRTPQITDYVPKAITRDCDGDCNVSIP